MQLRQNVDKLLPTVASHSNTLTGASLDSGRRSTDTEHLNAKLHPYRYRYRKSGECFSDPDLDSLSCRLGRRRTAEHFRLPRS